MESWRACKLGDLLEIKHGFAFKGEFFSEDGDHILLTPGNFREEGGLKLKGDKEKFYSGDFPNEYLLRTGDLLVAMTDLTQNAPILGSSAFVPEDDRFLHNQRLGKIVNLKADEIATKYLFYLFNTTSVRGQIKGSASGATVRHTSPSRIYEVSVDIPSLPAQHRIAGILSAYDELIENSQRRIRILEEMARALYREWFVHFRFPGHEKVPRIASPLGEIPQGWEVTDLAKVCADCNGIQTGPFGSQLHESDYSEEGVPVVMPKDLIGFRIRTDTIARIPEETADKLSRHRMQPGDIVYGRRGDIGRRAFLMPYQIGWFCGTGCLRIRPNTRAVNGWYLFNYLGQDDVVGLIAGRAQGVTMPNLNTSVMASVPVKLPTRKLQDDFARLTFPMAEAREALTGKIENLRRTRDLLLPRLLSDQLDLDARD
jgi:type I restriction enzyme, S subunit